MTTAPRSPALHAALAALVVLAGVWFMVRGPVRAFREGNYDAALVYSSARAWLTGANPYDAQAVSRAWADGGGPGDRDPMLTRKAAVLLYPPATFPVLAPFAALPWRVAEVAWVVLGTGLWVLTIAGVSRLGSLPWSAAAGKLLWAAGLAFAPASTCVAHGQTAILAGGLAVLGLAAGRRPLASAVLLALGAAVKPQVAALFIVHQAGRRRWLVAGAAVTLVLVVLGVGVLRMEASGVPWLASWRANLEAFTALDDGNPTRANPLRYQLINLHFLLHTFTDNRALVSWSVLGLVGLLCAAFFVADLRRPARRGDLASLSMVAVATLLVTYHRAYDAVLLVLPLAWALATLADAGERRAARRLAGAALACVLVFMAPGGSALQTLAPRLPDWLTASWAWECLALPHAVWALFALGVVLIVARSREARESP